MLSFRQASIEDLGGAWRVVDDARNKMIEIGRHQWTADYPSIEHLRADISLGHAFIIADGDEIVAYGAVAEDGEPEYENIIGRWLSLGHYMVVHRLAVSPACQGRGLSKHFFTDVEDLCRQRGIHSIKVDTNYDNVQMLGIMSKLGYEKCGEIDYHERGMRIAFEKLLLDHG
jgi:GNAT superfamily N-acetyltransferase